MNSAIRDVRKSISRHGNTWNLEVLREMVELYEKVHMLSAADQNMLVQSEKAIKYGTDDRQRLDVYFPSEKSKSSLPVVVFFHGGGFSLGDIDASPHIHSNIGNGCVTCLATYRLVPGATFPDGPDDIAAVLRWVESKIAFYGGDTSRITAIGHSAGGANLANAVFLGKVTSPLSRAVFISTPMTFDLTQKRRRDTMMKYFNTQDENEIASRLTSLAFFKAVEGELPCSISVILAQSDTEEHVDGNLEFVQEYRKKYHKPPAFEIVEGHNHVSHVFNIGLEDGDQVGPRLLELL